MPRNTPLSLIYFISLLSLSLYITKMSLWIFKSVIDKHLDIMRGLCLGQNIHMLGKLIQIELRTFTNVIRRIKTETLKS